MAAHPLATLIGPVVYWIHFSARTGRCPRVWIALQRLLSVPLLVRPSERSLSVDGVRVSCRVVSGQLGWLLDGASVVEAAGPGPGDLEVIQIHPCAAWWWRRRGRRVVPSFVLYRGQVHGIPPARPSKSLREPVSSAALGVRGAAGRRPRRADWRWIEAGPRGYEYAETAPATCAPASRTRRTSWPILVDHIASTATWPRVGRGFARVQPPLPEYADSARFGD